MNTGPVGIFDSGLGGLTVWRELRRQLPNEDIVYFADSRNCPYGRKSAGEIIALAHNITDLLLTSYGCKLIVVACNTATAAAIDDLRQSYQNPFVGMEPAIKQAALNTNTGRVGVLATKGTFDGRLYKQTSRKYANDIDVMVQIGDGLVELVEKNEYESDEARKLLHKYIDPMLEHSVDQIVLGCTHYPFYKPQIEAIVGSRVTVIDPAPAVARHVGEVLFEQDLKNAEKRAGADIFLSSGSIEPMQVLLTTMNNCGYSRRMVQVEGGQTYESLS
ncbi:MAG: glutamate racemase [Salinivirgaceae bacterium]|nr:glutamate racemase [Salinivirgaceae bacterium]